MHGGEEIVFAVVEHVVVHGHPGCYKLGDATFYEFFGQFGVFELLAYGHTFSCTYQFRQVGVEGMVGKACKFD